MSQAHRITLTYGINFRTPFIISSAVSDPVLYDMVSILSDNTPYVPASTIGHKIKATIRDHCMENISWKNYELCEGQSKDAEASYCIPDDTQSDDHGLCPLCRIFGLPGGERRAGFDFSGARLPENYHLLFRSLFEKTGSNVYARRSRNRIDSGFRRAAEDALFAAGLADMPVDLQGCVSEMPSHLWYSDEIRSFDAALILLGMRLITEIGGNINRGYGECMIVPSQIDWEKCITDHITEWEDATTRGSE